MLEVCGFSLLWNLLVGGVGQVACQGFLAREACVIVLELDVFSLECNEMSSSEF